MLPIAANVSSSQVSVSPSGVKGILKSVPPNLWPESCAVNEFKLRSNSSIIDHDFIVIAEFCEIEGPKPTITLPEEHSLLFDLDSYMLRVFSADTSGLQLSSSLHSGTLMNRPDCESCIFDRVTGTYAFVHYVTLRDAYARGYVRPFAVIYLTPSEEKLQSQMERICCVLRSAVREMRLANVSFFSSHLAHRLETLAPTDPKYDQIAALLQEFAVPGDESSREGSENVTSSIGSLWQLCGKDTVDHVIRLFNRLLDSLTGTATALSVTALRASALDPCSSLGGGVSIIFMNRLALIPKLCSTASALQNSSRANSNSNDNNNNNNNAAFSPSTEEVATTKPQNDMNTMIQRQEDRLSLLKNGSCNNEQQSRRSDSSDSTMTFVESISPSPSPSDSMTFQANGNNNHQQQNSCVCNTNKDNHLDIAAMTLPYFMQNAWPQGVITDLLEANHKTIAQALTWLAVGLPLVIAGSDRNKFLYDLASELASLCPTSSLYVDDDALSLRGITVVTGASSVNSPVDLPTSSPSLWVEQDCDKTIVSAWGPSLTYSPFSRLFRRAARLYLPMPLIRLLVANQWSFLVQLSFLHRTQSDSTLDQMLKRLGRFPADTRFIPAAMDHLRWLASLC